ncbi:hypothetical protein O4H49_18715 [Kiloniella laminariae]|uniref:Solute-binding protein family 3/N-terminal domain-containing protein n=1 Tax=Kiloniella laminariae TaxID=454162 RepID=A0ABT4LP15_9PROT|nr:hypothetical protein [Kiloniella laminariae]MCZ4282824.1 hypothetical protein [Kiloniella laminariae]
MKKTQQLPPLRTLLIFPFAVAIHLFQSNSTALAATEAFNIGGKEVAIAAPDDYCFLDKKYPGDARLLSILSQANPANEIITMITPCQGLKKWRAGEQDTLDDLMSVQVMRSTIQQDFTATEKNTIQGICQGMNIYPKEHMEQLMTQATDSVEAGSQIKVNNNEFLGVVEQDQTTCYVGVLQNLIDEFGKPAITATVGAPQVLKGKLFFQYISADFENEQTFSQLVNRLQKFLGTQAELN